MLINYIKLALKVLGRNKMYSAITLFGISFTLMVLMVILALYDTEMGANLPMSEADRMAFVDRIEMKTTYFDTTWTVDSALVAGEMVYDTLDFSTEEAGHSISTGLFSFRAIDEYLVDIEPMERRTILYERNFTVFNEGVKYQMNGLYVDDEYWNVFDFIFVAGEPLRPEQVQSAESVMVMSRRIAEEYFGSPEEAIGKTIPMGGRTFEVMGVVERARTSSSYVNADVYLPLTTGEPTLLSEQGNQGPFRAVYLAPSVAQLPAMKEALDYAGRNIPIPPDTHFENVRVFPFNLEEKYAFGLFHEDEIRDNVFYMRLAMFLCLGLFILIPTLNLININLTRMMERASEISVRKSYGASRGQILGQFLFENIIVTLVGGAIGLILSLLAIKFINSSGALPNTVLGFNGRVFFYSLILCLALGLLSGLLPAWRISKQQIADGLHQ